MLDPTLCGKEELECESVAVACGLALPATEFWLGSLLFVLSGGEIVLSLGVLGWHRSLFAMRFGSVESSSGELLG